MNVRIEISLPRPFSPTPSIDIEIEGVEEEYVEQVTESIVKASAQALQDIRLPQTGAKP